METKKQIAGVTGMVIGVAVMYFFMYYLPSTNVSIDTDLSKMASKFNEQCPMMVDRDTRLDNMSTSPGKVIVYNNTLVNVDYSTTDVVLDTSLIKSTLSPHIASIISTDPGMKMLREKECSFLYKYRDIQGTYLFSVAILPEDYQKGNQ